MGHYVLMRYGTTHRHGLSPQQVPSNNVRKRAYKLKARSLTISPASIRLSAKNVVEIPDANYVFSITSKLEALSYNAMNRSGIAPSWEDIIRCHGLSRTLFLISSQLLAKVPMFIGDVRLDEGNCGARTRRENDGSLVCMFPSCFTERWVFVCFALIRS